MLTRFADVAFQLVDNGYPVVPARLASKQPAVAGWQHVTAQSLTQPRLALLTAEHPDDGVFANCRGFIGVDIDIDDEARSTAVAELSRDILGPASVVRVGKRPRQLLLYRTDEPLRTTRLPGLEIRAQGAGVILFGIHPTTRRPYEYDGPSPLDVPVDLLPLATPDAVDKLLSQVAPLLGRTMNPLLSSASAPPQRASLLMDGRESYVRDQIWQLYLGGWRNPDAMARQVFDRLARTADLTRPHNSGTAYDLDFVRKRVLGTLRSAKPVFVKGPRPAITAEGLSEPTREAFRNSINAAGASGALRRASVLVSHAMLGSIGAANSAYVSTTTLAHRTGLAIDTVKRARRELRDKGFWTTVGDAGSRAKIAHYLPRVGDDHG